MMSRGQVFFWTTNLFPNCQSFEDWQSW